MSFIITSTILLVFVTTLTLHFEMNFRVNQINADAPKRKSLFKKNRNTVGTVDRYKFENADGSITWGYKNEDGSFKVKKFKIAILLQKTTSTS